MRRAFALLATVTLFAALIGCGGSSDTTTADSGAAAPPPPPGPPPGMAQSAGGGSAAAPAVSAEESGTSAETSMSAETGSSDEDERESTSGETDSSSGEAGYVPPGMEGASASRADGGRPGGPPQGYGMGSPPPGASGSPPPGYASGPRFSAAWLLAWFSASRCYSGRFSAARCSGSPPGYLGSPPPGYGMGPSAGLFWRFSAARLLGRLSPSRLRRWYALPGFGFRRNVERNGELRRVGLCGGNDAVSRRLAIPEVREHPGDRTRQLHRPLMDWLKGLSNKERRQTPSSTCGLSRC